MTTSDGAVMGTTKVVDNGPASLRFNLVVFGDGYQAGQLPQYASDVDRFVGVLFATAPFGALSMAKLQSPLVATRSPHPSGADQLFVGLVRPPLARASFIRNDSPSVATTTLWWRSRSSRLTAVVCSGRKRPQSSNGQCDPIPSDRRS